MAILNFQKPDKVIMIESTDFSGRFEFKSPNNFTYVRPLGGLDFEKIRCSIFNPDTFSAHCESGAGLPTEKIPGLCCDTVSTDRQTSSLRSNKGSVGLSSHDLSDPQNPFREGKMMAFLSYFFILSWKRRDQSVRVEGGHNKSESDAFWRMFCVLLSPQPDGLLNWENIYL